MHTQSERERKPDSFLFFPKENVFGDLQTNLLYILFLKYTLGSQGQQKNKIALGVSLKMWFRRYVIIGFLLWTYVAQ